MMIFRTASHHRSKKKERDNVSMPKSKSEVTAAAPSESPPLTSLQKLASKSVLVTFDPTAPFTIIKDEEYRKKLNCEWAPFFGKCKDYWTMISTPRKTKSSKGTTDHDKYMFPPGFGIKLRSNNELFRFLTFCAEQCEITDVPTPDVEYSLYKSFFDKIVTEFLDLKRKR